jgi:hypothetical protein
MAANAFSLAPALANGGVIDYSTSEGIKIYSAATSSLVEDPLFDCDSEGLSHFLGKVGIRAQTNPRLLDKLRSHVLISENTLSPMWGPNPVLLRTACNLELPL